jgi:hypothetical protein
MQAQDRGRSHKKSISKTHIPAGKCETHRPESIHRLKSVASQHKRSGLTPSATIPLNNAAIVQNCTSVETTPYKVFSVQKDELSKSEYLVLNFLHECVSSFRPSIGLRTIHSLKFLPPSPESPANSNEHGRSYAKRSARSGKADLQLLSCARALSDEPMSTTLSSSRPNAS